MRRARLNSAIQDACRASMTMMSLYLRIYTAIWGRPSN